MKIGRFIITLLIGGLIGGCIASLTTTIAFTSLKLSLCYTFKCHFNLINLCGTYPSLKYVFNYDSKRPFITNVYPKHILMNMRRIHMIRKLI